MSFCAAITAGGRWPDGTDVEIGDCLIWSGEDGLGDTLVPRFLATGGDPKRLQFVNNVTERGQPRPFDPALDMPKLEAACRALPALKLIVLDPVVAVVTGDSHKNTETRRGLQPVVDLAAELGCAVLGITHLSKGTSGREPLERVAGSIAFGAVAHIVLATVKPADPDAPRRLVRAKSNIGPDTGGFEYTLFGAPVPGHDFNAQRIEWGQALEGSARELMAIEQPDNDAAPRRRLKTFCCKSSWTVRCLPRRSRLQPPPKATNGAPWSVQRAGSKSRLPRVLMACLPAGAGSCPGRRPPILTAKTATMINLGGLRQKIGKSGPKSLHRTEDRQIPESWRSSPFLWRSSPELVP